MLHSLQTFLDFPQFTSTLPRKPDNSRKQANLFLSTPEIAYKRLYSLQTFLDFLQQFTWTLPLKPDNSRKQANLFLSIPGNLKGTALDLVSDLVLPENFAPRTRSSSIRAFIFKEITPTKHAGIDYFFLFL